MASEDDFQSWIILVCHQDQAIVFVLAQVILFACSSFKAETFQVRIILLVGIVKGNCPYLIGIELLDDAYIVFVVIAQVEVRSIKFSGIQYNQNVVVALEFTQIFASSVVVEAEHVTVKPYFTSAQCGTTPLFQNNFVYRQACQDDALALPAANGHFTKVTFEDDASYTRIRFQGDFDNFRFPIGVGAEVGNA